MIYIYKKNKKIHIEEKDHVGKDNVDKFVIEHYQWTAIGIENINLI